jgi:hypothetical protein
MGKKSRSGYGIRIRDKFFGSYFRELGKNLLGVKILKFFNADADPGIIKTRISFFGRPLRAK